MSERPSLSGGVQPQTRVSVEPQWVSRRAAPPSTGTRWISGSRLRQFVYAMWRPSGEKRGCPTRVRSTVSRQARPGAALGGERGDPEVVLGDEAQQVVVEVRETEIRDVVTHHPMLSGWRGRGNSYVYAGVFGYAVRGAGRVWPGVRPGCGSEHVRNGFVSLRAGVPSYSTKPFRSHSVDAPGRRHGMARSRLTPERESELYAAVLDLLREVGYDALTMDAVAARTHSSKATLYRQWGASPSWSPGRCAPTSRPTSPRSTPAPCAATSGSCSNGPTTARWRRTPR